MKKLRNLIVVFALVFSSGFAQEKLIKKTGEEISIILLEEDYARVKYKRFDNQDGPTYIVNKSDFFKLCHEDSTFEIFNISSKGTNMENEDYSAAYREQAYEKTKDLVWRSYLMGATFNVLRRFVFFK